MKDREYYEKMISDGLDRQLSEGETEELELAMRTYPELVEFREHLTRQATLVRSLPELSTDAALRVSAEKKEKRGIVWSAWNLRISVPLPVAALVVLILAVFTLFRTNIKPIPEAPELTQGAPVIEYVQIERLKPATAVLLQQKQNENQSHEETL